MMKDLTEQIKKQISNCSDLLAVFQQERQLYCDKQQVGISEVMQILERKKTLVEVFDTQQSIMKKIREAENNSDTKNSEQKILLRKLSSLLEQLLVIDHENEKLLRENLSCRKVTQSPVKSESNLAREPQRVRPALQRQLPFIPGNQQAISPLFVRTMAPAVQPAASVAGFGAESDVNSNTIDEQHPRPLHQLKNYAKTRLMKLNSKYA